MSDTLGERVKLMREKHRMTQDDIAKSTNISRSNIGKIENNQIVPNCNAILELSNLFGVTTDWLIAGRVSNSLSNKESTYNAFGNLTKEEIEIIQKYRDLSSVMRDDIKDYLDMKHKKTMDKSIPGSSKSKNGRNGTGEEAAATETA